MQKNKIQNLNSCIEEREIRQKRKLDGRYRCAMAGDRLAGPCEILIFDSMHNNGELFQLSFSANGMTTHQYLDPEEVVLWRQHKNDAMSITYRQALTLLGDAVRQNYKYHTTQWSQTHDSLHIQRIWEKEYYDNNKCDVNWLLHLHEPMQFVAVYLDAIANKDAVLLYDIMANEVKQHVSRDVYAYSWNHVLEELHVSDYDIVSIVQSADQKSWNLYIAIYGGYEASHMLSIDLCLKVIWENGSLRILNEYVLDATHVSEACAEYSSFPIDRGL